MTEKEKRTEKETYEKPELKDGGVVKKTIFNSLYGYSQRISFQTLLRARIHWPEQGLE